MTSTRCPSLKLFFCSDILFYDLYLQRCVSIEEESFKKWLEIEGIVSVYSRLQSHSSPLCSSFCKQLKVKQLLLHTHTHTHTQSHVPWEGSCPVSSCATGRKYSPQHVVSSRRLTLWNSLTVQIDHVHLLPLVTCLTSLPSDCASVLCLLLSTASSHPGDLQRRPWRDPHAHIQVWRHQCSGEGTHTHTHTRQQQQQFVPFRKWRTSDENNLVFYKSL